MTIPFAVFNYLRTNYLCTFCSAILFRYKKFEYTGLFVLKGAAEIVTVNTMVVATAQILVRVLTTKQQMKCNHMVEAASALVTTIQACTS